MGAKPCCRSPTLRCQPNSAGCWLGAASFRQIALRPSVPGHASGNRGNAAQQLQYIGRTVRYPTISPELIGYCRYLRPLWVYRRTLPRASVTERVEAPAYLALELFVAAENHLLGLLDAAALALLKPHMRTISVEHGELLHGSSSEIESGYFPRSCIVSVLASTDQGATAETSIVGREGMIGSSTIHGITTSFADSIVQVAGDAVRIPAAEIHRAGLASESFRKVVAMFDLSLLAQSQQSTACQALHQVENRAARWLMQCRKRLGSNDIRLTQEFFGQMLGFQAHHHQSGRTHPAECRPHSDRPGPYFHPRRQGTARRLLRLLRSHRAAVRGTAGSARLKIPPRPRN